MSARTVSASSNLKSCQLSVLNFLIASKFENRLDHCSDVIISTVPSQITSVSFVFSTVCSGTDQGKHRSSASLAFVRGIHRWPVNSPHKGPVTRKMFSFDDVIIWYSTSNSITNYIDVVSSNTSKAFDRVHACELLRNCIIYGRISPLPCVTHCPLGNLNEIFYM